MSRRTGRANDGIATERCERCQRREPHERREHRERRYDHCFERGLRTPEVAALLAEVAAHRPPASGQTSRVLVLADRVFDRLGTLPTAPPILAVVTTPSTPAPLRLDRDSVVLDRIQDPGNVGAILRSVAAAGITQVATTPGTAWCWSPKVLRAAMGGHFALEIHESVAWSDLRSALRLPLAGTWAHGGSSLYDQDLRPACVWVFGNEGDGIDTQIAESVDWRLAIPQSDRVESLNVAAAVAICLFEQRRQRLTRNR